MGRGRRGTFHNPDAYPVNGVTFNAFGNFLPNIGASGSSLDHYDGYGDPNTLDGNYNFILENALFNDNPDNINISWNGMTPGHTYQVEVWVNDGRGNDRTETLTGGANTSAALTIAPSSGGPGQFIIGTFTYNSPTLAPGAPDDFIGGGRERLRAHDQSAAGSRHHGDSERNLATPHAHFRPDRTCRRTAPTSLPGLTSTIKIPPITGPSGLVVNGTKFLAFQ